MRGIVPVLISWVKLTPGDLESTRECRVERSVLFPVSQMALCRVQFARTRCLQPAGWRTPDTT